MFQKLEDTVLSPELALHVACLVGTFSPINPHFLFLPALWETTSSFNMQEENRLLQKEVSCLEDLLAQTRAEKDELASKHHAISERLEKALRVEAAQREGDGSLTLMELRQRFEDDEKAYKCKLLAYQEGQQHQAQLVQRLQNKVLQYKKRCGELEQQLLEKTSESEHQKQMVSTLPSSASAAVQGKPISDLFCPRGTSLSQMNMLLREQLDQMKCSNQRLAGELEKATSDLHRLRGELEQRASQWGNSRESSGAYLSNEHSRILLLWRQAATLRSLAEAQKDMARTARRLQTACLNLDSNLRLSESGTACSLEKQALQGARLEQQLREKVWEMIQLQSRWDGEKELQLQLESAQDMLGAVRKQLSDCQQEVQVAEQQLQEREELARALQDCRRDLQHCKSSTLLEKSFSSLLHGSCRQRSLEQLEEKTSALKKELVVVKESLNQAILEKDMLENEKECVSCALSKAKTNSAKLELAINKLKSEESELRDSLAKMGALAEGLAQDKVNLNRLLLQLEEEKSSLLEQRRELEQERAGLREQLVHLEQELAWMSAARQELEQSCQVAEERQEALGEEMRLLRREKAQLQDHLTQVRAGPGGDLPQITLPPCTLLCKSQASHDIYRSWAITALMLFLTAIPVWSATCLCSRVRDVTAQEGLSPSRPVLTPCSALARCQESLRLALREEKEEAVHRLHQEKEELLSKCEAEKEELAEEVLSLQQERDESLLLLENDKQKVSRESNGRGGALAAGKVQSQPLPVEGDVGSGIACWLWRTQRRALGNSEAWRTYLIKGDLRNLASKFEDAVAAHQREVKSLNEHIKELARERDSAVREAEQLRTQLRLAEDARDGVHKDLIELHDRLQEGEEARELQRKEMLETCRVLGDETREKEIMQKSNTELRDAIKKMESKRISLKRGLEEKEQKITMLEETKAAAQKEAGELRANLRKVEKSQMEARRELQELHRQVKMLGDENSKKGKEVSELQARLLQQEQREQLCRRQSLELKQRIAEMEGSQECVRKEVLSLQRKLVEVEWEARAREKGLTNSLGESHSKEKKLRDELHNMELKLQQAGGVSEGLQLRLSTTEGHLQGLETELAKAEAAKREVESKLGMLHSALRRTLGLSGQSPSPQRPCSPSKDLFMWTGEVPIVKLSVSCTCFSPFSFSTSPHPPRHLPLDDLRTQVMNLNRRLNEMASDRDQTNNRIVQLQKLLADSEEGKRGMDGRLSSAQMALALQEETIRRVERERHALAEQIATLECSMHAREEKNRELQVKVTRLKAKDTKLETDKRRLKEVLEAAESRATKLELSHRSMEGELQHVRLSLVDRDTEIQALQEQVQALRCQLGDSESKSAMLQQELGRLGHSLAQTEDKESHLKDKVQSLSQALTDASTGSSTLQENIFQLQKALTAAEQDRRVLQERMDSVRQALSDSKRQNHSLTDTMRMLQDQLGELELRCRELEAQVEHLQEVSRGERKDGLELKAAALLQNVQDENSILQERLMTLQRAVAHLEGENKELERSAFELKQDNSALKKTLSKAEREMFRKEDNAMWFSAEKKQLDLSLSCLRQEVEDTLRQNQPLQVSPLMERAHAQRLMELETERLRSTQLQAEWSLESRERSHKQRVRVLEDQVEGIGAEETVLPHSGAPDREMILK
uniref:Ciliary rootlet coiled-coil, rootletin family member 2 n=1 Tax=Chelonoidis abingdonii TaxID=106734 RepID=A0A8C0IU23_CHEAB